MNHHDQDFEPPLAWKLGLTILLAAVIVGAVML